MISPKQTIYYIITKVQRGAKGVVGKLSTVGVSMAEKIYYLCVVVSKRINIQKTNDMKPELIQAFMLKNGECFDSCMIPEIEKQLANVDDSKSVMLMGLSLQKPTLILIIAIILGWDRFFLDDIGMGVLKLLTCYGCYIWWLVDIFSAKKRTYAYNYKKFSEAMMLCR